MRGKVPETTEGTQTSIPPCATPTHTERHQTRAGDHPHGHVGSGKTQRVMYGLTYGGPESQVFFFKKRETGQASKTLKRKMGRSRMIHR